jgi:hypothetical protein
VGVEHGTTPTGHRLQAALPAAAAASASAAAAGATAPTCVCLDLEEPHAAPSASDTAWPAVEKSSPRRSSLPRSWSSSALATTSLAWLSTSRLEPHSWGGVEAGRARGAAG